MPIIRAVTFDWGDTLAANYGMPYLATQRRAFRGLEADLKQLGATPAADWFERTLTELREVFASSIDPVLNPEHREFDFAALLSRAVTSAGGDAEKSQFRAAIDRCADLMTDTVIPFGESLPALMALKKRGLRLGILSHVPWPGDACRRWFVRHGLANCLDFYSLSCEIGWIKPNPRHFQHAIALAGCAPDEILHVGDHPVRDVAGGRANGLRTCLRITENIYPAEQLHACHADGEILHLDELPALIEHLSSAPSSAASA